MADAGVPLLDVGAGVFTSAFLVEEIASGLRAVSHGQREAALSQGLRRGRSCALSSCRGWPTPGSRLSASILT